MDVREEGPHRPSNQGNLVVHAQSAKSEPGAHEGPARLAHDAGHHEPGRRYLGCPAPVICSTRNASRNKFVDPRFRPDRSRSRSFAPMNFRSTTLLFGLLVGMLWLFGLTVAHKKTAVDAS